MKIEAANERMFQQAMWERELDAYSANRPRTGSSVESTQNRQPAHLSGKEVMMYLDYPWDFANSAQEPRGSRPGTAESASGLGASGTGVRLRLGLRAGESAQGRRAEVLTMGEQDGEDGQDWRWGSRTSSAGGFRERSSSTIEKKSFDMSYQLPMAGLQPQEKAATTLTLQDLVRQPDMYLMGFQRTSILQDNEPLIPGNRVTNVPVDYFLPSGQHLTSK